MSKITLKEINSKSPFTGYIFLSWKIIVKFKKANINVNKSCQTKRFKLTAYGFKQWNISFIYLHAKLYVYFNSYTCTCNSFSSKQLCIWNDNYQNRINRLYIVPYSMLPSSVSHKGDIKNDINCCHNASFNNVTPPPSPKKK